MTRPPTTPAHMIGTVTDVRSDMVDVTAWGDTAERLIPGQVTSIVRVTADFNSEHKWNGQLEVAEQLPIGTRFTISIEESK